MTQAELASAIERGLAQSGVVERKLAFIMAETEDGETSYRCCLLGAALIGHFGLDEALKMKAGYQTSDYLDFVIAQLDITRTLARAVEWDYSQLNKPRTEVLTKLRANQYAE